MYLLQATWYLIVHLLCCLCVSGRPKVVSLCLAFGHLRAVVFSMQAETPFTVVRYQISCISNIYIIVHNYQNYS